MERTYLRVTPGEEPVIVGDIPETVASLSKLTRTNSASLIQRLNPFHKQPPIRFEFVALCTGEDEPVEFYYGADDHLDALEQRLRSIYPASYEMERVEVDLTKRLLEPAEFSRKEFTERLDDGRLYHEFEPSATGQATVSDGGEVAVTSDSTDADAELPDRAEQPENADTVIDDIDFAAPQTVDVDEPLTTLDRPTETPDGTILARPPLAEVEPYGVEWWGTAARRKDWMTTLTGFIDVRGQEIGLAGEGSGQSRFPLSSLLKQLAEADQPLAFQVVFQRRSDWSRDARRRAGELLDGTDTLLQKLLSLESPGERRRSSSRRNPQRPTRRMSRRSALRRPNSSPGDGPSRPTDVEAASRYDQVRQNSPKRTFSVNLQLLTLAVDGDEPDDLAATLDPLRSVFDLVDGQFYEIDGRRLRSSGYLPGSGERHARKVLDRFRSRSLATGKRRVAITNRSETRPDLVLNGNELANFLAIPPAADIPSPPPAQADQSRAESPAGETPGEDVETAEGVTVDTQLGDRPFEDSPLASIPETVVHRDAQVNQLTSALEPLASGDHADPALITGPTGSGKTCIATFAVDEFSQDHSTIDAAYVNCWADHTRFQVLYRILDQLRSTVDIHRQSTPRDVLLERLRELNDRPSVIILDEVDQLDDKGLLYDLLTLPQFALVLVANQEADLLDGLDERLASRLRSCQRIRCRPYTDDQLVDILDAWSRRELESTTIDESELTRIANAAGGDARVAITTLRIASRQADQAAEDRITQAMVESALPEARQEIHEQFIEELTPHQQAVFRVVEEQGRATPGDLYDEYQTMVEDPKSDRTVRNYLHKLERYNLVVAEGSTRDRVYRCVAPGASSGNPST